MSLIYNDDDPVRLSDDREAIIAIDQRELPGKVSYLTITKRQEMYDAIKTLAVRGAPCIGIFAGYCVAVLASTFLKDGLEPDALLKRLEDDASYLVSSRPTAVNLSWAVKRQMELARKSCSAGASSDEVVKALYDEAIKIHEEDINMCLRIAEYGLSLLHKGDGILTHCNAGALATSRYGTGLGPILLGQERGYDFKVFSDETRPLLQGARLSAFELCRAGVDETVICDNMASLVMKQGKIQAVLVGCDRVAANGDTANKIGTSGAAILAKHYGIPFYVLGPCSSIDINTPTGDDIPIEERDPDEIGKLWYERPMTPEGAKCFNPAFDVTDHELITAIVTDKGILKPPYDESIAKLFVQ